MLNYEQPNLLKRKCPIVYDHDNDPIVDSTS